MDNSEKKPHELIPVSKAIKNVLVDSTNGIVKYMVSTDGENWSCTCNGYKYRGECRHIKETIERS